MFWALAWQGLWILAAAMLGVCFAQWLTDIYGGAEFDDFRMPQEHV